MMQMKPIPFFPDWSPPVARVTGVPCNIVLLNSAEVTIPVLIAEDDPISRKLAAVVIETGGFRTIVTNNGADAMSALRAQNGPCVAVLDWMMPGMDGAEVCRRIRESGKSVYVIMLTARTTKEDIVAGLQGGADDYLSKPFDRHELLARIRTGIRILEVQASLRERVRELEESNLQTGDPIFQMPL